MIARSPKKKTEVKPDPPELQNLALPKREKEEKQRPRSAAKKVRDAWKRCERQASQWLQDCDGPDPQTEGVRTSTGRVGDITRFQYDTSSRHYKGEVKRRKSDWPAGVRAAWLQICQIAAKYPGYEPILFLFCPDTVEGPNFVVDGHKRNLPPIHAITPERHARLLECERKCEELGL